MQRGNVRRMTVAALFSAMIFLTTAYLLHIPIGAAGGYIHLGDTFIYLAGAFLPPVFAIPAAMVGAGLADVLTGAGIWLLPTLIIKPALILFFDYKNQNIICKKNMLGVLFGAFATIAGYYLAEGILFGNFISPLVSILPNAVQASGSGAVFLAAGFFFDKSGLKQRLG